MKKKRNIVMPGSKKGVNAVKDLLEHLGIRKEDHDDIESTPRRVLSLYEEMTAGYRDNPDQFMGKVFDSSYDEMVVCGGIPFFSLCEHHMVPFYGSVTIGYLPKDGKVLGLSKMVRLVRCYALRLQLQERMTQQIANTIQSSVVKPDGCGVIVTARHLCMEMRGVKSRAETTTSCVLERFRFDTRLKDEFFLLAKNGASNQVIC